MLPLQLHPNMVRLSSLQVQCGTLKKLYTIQVAHEVHGVVAVLCECMGGYGKRSHLSELLPPR